MDGTAKAAASTIDELDKIQNAYNPPSIFEGFSNLLEPLLSKTQQITRSPSSLTFRCPCDIEASVNGGGLYTARYCDGIAPRCCDVVNDDNEKKLLLNLPMIQGSGVVRVLYANPQLRIFLSPTQGDGGWEDQGLVVVQVRSDLIRP